MPTPYPDPFSGLAQGLQQGMQMGLLMRQQGQAEAQQKQAEEEKQLTDLLKTFQLGVEMTKIKHPDIRNKGMSMITQVLQNPIAAKRLGIDPKAVPATIQWNDSLQPHLDETSILLKSYNDPKSPIYGNHELLASSLASTLGRAADALDSEQYKNLAEYQKTGKDTAVKQMEEGNLNQASALSGLIKNNPDIAQGAGAEPAMNQLLSQSGTKGQEILAAGMKQEQKPEKDYTQTATLMNSKDGKPHIYKYNPKTDRYDIDQGLAPKSESDRYADTQVLGRLVDKFNADPTVRKVEQMDEFANLITSVAQSDNPIGHASLETLMARASGEVGNLSEADKKPFGTSKALSSKINQYFSEIYSGKKTPENIAFIHQLADTFQKAGLRKKASLARERSKQYGKAYRGKFSETEIFDMLSPGGDFNTSPDTTPASGKSPVAGAKKAPDGNWYLEKNGKFFRVD